jgi:hypothetical protein
MKVKGCYENDCLLLKVNYCYRIQCSGFEWLPFIAMEVTGCNGTSAMKVISYFGKSMIAVKFTGYKERQD